MPKHRLDQMAEEGADTKRRLVEASPVAINTELSSGAVRSDDFDRLPNEIQLTVAREVANLPNRRHAIEGLINLRTANRHINRLILTSQDLHQTTQSLQKYPGVESRYVAICCDVVNGISVGEAFRQNAPLPSVDHDLNKWHVEAALEKANPDKLAALAKAFSSGTDPAFEQALTGVAWASNPEQLALANIDNLTTLASAFTKTNLDRKDFSVAIALDGMAQQVNERDAGFLPHVNVEHISTLAGAFCRHSGPNIEEAIAKLASEVTTRADNLLPQASAEQLRSMGVSFRNHRDALAMVTKEMAKRPEAALIARDRLRSRERDRSVGR